MHVCLATIAFFVPNPAAPPLHTHAVLRFAVWGSPQQRNRAVLCAHGARACDTRTAASDDIIIIIITVSHLLEVGGQPLVLYQLVVQRHHRRVRGEVRKRQPQRFVRDGPEDALPGATPAAAPTA